MPAIWQWGLEPNKRLSNWFKPISQHLWFKNYYITSFSCSSLWLQITAEISKIKESIQSNFTFTSDAVWDSDNILFGKNVSCTRYKMLLLSAKYNYGENEAASWCITMQELITALVAIIWYISLTLWHKGIRKDVFHSNFPVTV